VVLLKKFIANSNFRKKTVLTIDNESFYLVEQFLNSFVFKSEPDTPAFIFVAYG